MTVVHDSYGGAYGRETDGGRRAAAQLRTVSSIDLDGTYSAKAFACALDAARPRRDIVLVNLRLENPQGAMTNLPEVTFHIYPTDCDMLGHLNHATMLNFLERARWQLLEPQIDVRGWAKQPVFPVVRHVDIGYLAQSLPGEDLVIRLRAARHQAHELHHPAGRQKGGKRRRRRGGIDRVRRGES